MRGIWSKKFIFWNFVALFILKSAIAPSLQFAQLVLKEVISPQDVIAHTNAFRSKLKLPVLKESAILDAAAEEKLNDMMRNQYFAHFSPTGVSPWHWFQASGYTYSFAGENLAMGFSDAKSAVDAWINSPSHRSNLAHAKFKEIGVATRHAVMDGERGIIIVQLFGAPSIRNVAAAPKTRGLETQESSLESDPGPAVATDSKATIAVRRLNRGFMFYAYLLAMISLAHLLFREFRKERVMALALHLLLFGLSVSIPVMSMLQQARIG